MANPMFSMLSRQKEYTVETSEGTFSGTYVGKETTAQGFCFYYLENDEDDYRATLVIREKEEQYWVDCTKTDGSHETLAQMADFISIDGTMDETQDNHFSQLSECEVVEIRQKASRGLAQGEIASAYGVTESTISRVTRGETWAEVGGPIAGE